MSGVITIHSRFKIPIDANESCNCTVFKQSGDSIKNVDKLLKDVMKNDEDFCGKVIIFCEDFKQVLSVFLLRVKNSKEPSDTKRNIKISKEMIIEYDNKENSILQLIRVIFSILNKNVHSTHYITSRAILADKYEHIDKLNNKLIFIFSRKARTFNSFVKLLMIQITIIKMLF
ncbi:hypothetical protein Pfo_005103 [Paulownia fortunei]|nr:hypothetical protein Pfo_005103 [Paulownia fortunei]